MIVLILTLFIMADKKPKIVELPFPSGITLGEPEAPNTDPTKGFVTPPKKSAAQKVPSYVKGFLDPSGEEKKRQDRQKSEENREYPLGKHDSGYHVIKGPTVYTGGMFGLPKEEAPELREDTRIPVSSNAYSSVTDIKDADLPINAAEYFSKMILEGKDRPKEKKDANSRTLKEAYDEDLMAGMALLADEHPNFDQTRENAERLLWKLPLKGGPRSESPSRKSIIINRLKKK